MKEVTGQTRARRDVFSVASRERRGNANWTRNGEWRDAGQSRWHVGNELPVTRHKQESDWRRERGRDGIRTEEQQTGNEED